jgi:two-component system, chemotaxis family, protein-glutamate methylesterase/glutaminase
METHDIIVVGASAGGVTALKNFVKGLPVDLNASILVVSHIPEFSHSRLPEILTQARMPGATHPRVGSEMRQAKFM